MFDDVVNEKRLLSAVSEMTETIHEQIASEETLWLDPSHSIYIHRYTI